MESIRWYLQGLREDRDCLLRRKQARHLLRMGDKVLRSEGRKVSYGNGRRIRSRAEFGDAPSAHVALSERAMTTKVRCCEGCIH